MVVRGDRTDAPRRSLRSCGADSTDLRMTLNVAVFGSCVSRDAVGLVPEQLTPAHYTARQAWVSAGSPAMPALPFDRLKSPFQRRMLREDFHSTLFSNIAQHAPTADVVLIDIVDDRLGVVEFLPGRFATLSAELGSSGWLAGDRVFRRRRLHLGDPAHLERFTIAARQVKRALIKADSWEKTLLIRANYAAQSIEGDALVGDYGIAPDEWDRRYAPYYSVLSELGFRALEPLPELLHSTRSHRWGMHPIHYQDAASRELAERVAAFGKSLR